MLYNNMNTYIINTICEFVCTGIIGEDELVQITRLIPLDRYMQLCTMLGQIRPQSFSEGTMLAVLTAWQKASLCNRQERLAKILLNIGCYNAALKLDAKCKHARPNTTINHAMKHMIVHSSHSCY